MSSPGDGFSGSDVSRNAGSPSRGVDCDPWIDSFLQAPVPRGTTRTDLDTLFSDDAIDRMLRDVPCRMTSVQPLVAGRGRRVPVDLDSIAAGFDRRIMTPLPAGPSRPPRLLRSAIRVVRDALHVAVVLSVVVAIFTASVFTSRWLSSPVADVAATPPRIMRDGPTQGETENAPEDATSRGGVTADDLRYLAGSGRPRQVASEAAGIATADGSGSIPSDAMSADVAATEVGGAENDLLDTGAPDDRLPDDRLIASDEGGQVRPLSPSATVSSGLRAAPVSPSAGDSLQVVAVRPSIDRLLPYHRGYDLAFEMARGEAPFVDPSLAAALAIDHPPLSRRTDSFDRLVRLVAATGLRRDRLKQAIGGLRVEDVLAALPPPGGSGPTDTRVGMRPTVRLAAVDSISGRPSSRLLEVSVTAPRSSAPRPSAGLVFVLDASAAAGADEAWPSVCRGVEDAVRRVDPVASIDVVVFSERPVVMASNVAARDMRDVCRRLSEMRPRGGGDLHGCLATVRKTVRSPRCVIVAHAGSIARAERDGDPDLAAWRRSQQSARDGDASTGGDAGGFDGSLAGNAIVEVVEIDAASAANGEAVGRDGPSIVDGVGLDSMPIRRSIVAAALGGESAPRFEQCRLEVAFDPKQVAAYRLVGHRRQVVDMVSSRSSSVDLADGECVRAVYEVVLREEDARGGQARPADPPVATATCRYRIRGDATESSVVAGISASRCAVDPVVGALEAHALWLAVAVAELAAGSAHVESPQRLRETVRQRFERVGLGSPGSPGDDPSDETASTVRRLRGIWTLL